MLASGYSIGKVVAAAFAAVLLCGVQQALANVTIKIVNKLSVDLTSGEVVNRQDIKIITDPPTTVAAGGTGEFEVSQGGSLKNEHLKLQYAAGSETIAFGFKYDQTITGPTGGCFEDTPSDIQGNHKNCAQGTITFTFSPK